MAKGGPELCGCADCRNFIASRENIYPGEVRKLFDELGIDYRKETEVLWRSRLENGLHQYGGKFHFPGRVEYKGHTDADEAIVTERFTMKCEQLNGKPGPSREKLTWTIQIDFGAECEWLLRDVEEPKD